MPSVGLIVVLSVGSKKVSVKTNNEPLTGTCKNEACIA
jgi:hypothetical protein